MFSGLWEHDLDSAGDRQRQTHNVPHISAGGYRTIAPLHYPVIIDAELPGELPHDSPESSESRSPRFFGKSSG